MNLTRFQTIFLLFTIDTSAYSQLSAVEVIPARENQPVSLSSPLPKASVSPLVVVERLVTHQTNVPKMFEKGGVN